MPAAHPQITELPWAQQRYAPDRLSPIADGGGVTVAVIDSGVDAGHPQLVGRVVKGADRLDPGGDGHRDCVGHGTAVASIISGLPTDDVRFRGLAPGASILPVRVSEQQVLEGTTSGRSVSAPGLAAALRWAVSHGADVVNLSVVLYRDEPALRAAVAEAVAAGVVVVAAAGNLHEKGDPRPYPAAYDGVLGVGAITADGRRLPESQIGPYVDVVAPGGEIVAAAPGGGHATLSGTSFAAPFAAATAALIRQYRPGLSPEAVIRRIVATADPAPGGGYGAGVLNPQRAVTEPLVDRGAAQPETRPLPALAEDPARQAAAARAATNRRTALHLALGAAGVVALLLIGATVVPRGARRRWLPAAPPRRAPSGTDSRSASQW